MCVTCVRRVCVSVVCVLSLCVFVVCVRGCHGGGFSVRSGVGGADLGVREEASFVHVGV